MSLEKQVRVEVEDFLPTPVPQGGIISSRFGLRMHPVYKQFRPHNGIDIACEVGTDFISVSDGLVVDVGYSESQGNFVVIKHSSSVQTLYAHAQSTSVSAGEAVTKGQVIGTVGDTGLVTGAHLHLELIVWGEYYDPLIFLETEANNLLTLKDDEGTIANQKDRFEGTGISEPKLYGKQTVWSIAVEITQSLDGKDIYSVIDDIVKLNPSAFPTGDPSYRYADVDLLLPEYNRTSELPFGKVRVGSAYQQVQKNGGVGETETKLVGKRTVWSIASEITEFSVARDIYSVMDDIVKLNPSAFPTGDPSYRYADIELLLPKYNATTAMTIE